jgi:hypothetical protein
MRGIAIGIFMLGLPASDGKMEAVLPYSRTSKVAAALQMGRGLRR